jgi:hypothetical protein
VLAMAVALLGGCHWVFPYGAAGRDTRADARHDGASDRPGSDRAGDGQHSDSAVDGAACVEPLLSKQLAECAPCGDVNNTDCDGLPGAKQSTQLTQRDYYDGQCNKLLWEDHFDRPPSGRWTSFGDTVDALWRWSCGWYSQDWPGGGYPDPMHMAWARATMPTPSPLTSADYLVEARVKLGKIGNPQAWGVGIVARYTPQAPFANIVCEARVDNDPASPGLEGNPAVPFPDVRIETRVAAGGQWTAGWPLPPRIKTFDGAEGQVYNLQLWYTSNFPYDVSSPQCSPGCKAIVCRVCDDSQCYRTGILALWIGNPSFPATPLLPTAPGSVGLRTYGRAASFDYVRVFQLTNP